VDRYSSFFAVVEDQAHASPQMGFAGKKQIRAHKKGREKHSRPFKNKQQDLSALSPGITALVTLPVERG